MAIVTAFLLLLLWGFWASGMHLESLSSPCPRVFEYALDQRNELYGRILVNNPSANVVALNVELSVGNKIEGYNGKIELGHSRSQVINEILNGRPILYKVLFPVWRGVPPKVTKIAVNGNLICSGPPLNRRLFEILTTINLQHTLRVNVSPQGGVIPPTASLPSSPPGGSFDGDQSNGGFDDSNFPGGFEVIYQNKPNQDNYPANPFFAAPTTSTTIKPPRVKDDPQNVNQVITFVVPTTTTTTTTRPSAITPEIDIRTDHLEEICGKSLATNYLIAYGNPISKGHHPWLAALYHIDSRGLIFICGGNLISKKHVLTAAHCMKRNGRKIHTDDLLVILGKHNIQQWVDDSLMLYARSIAVHRDYRDLSADADIAMITLVEEVQFRKFVRPICLWSEPDELDLIVGERGIVAGWGKDENGFQSSAEAKQVVLPIVSQEKCRSSQETLAEITSERTFCAGYRNGSGPCNGDSGGGFIMQRGGRWTLRGLVSLSLFDTSKVCDLSQYLVFTDVTKFSAWIRSFL